MITHVDIRLLPEDLQEVVLAKYRVALMDPARKLSMLEASWLYHFRYDHVRNIAAKGRLRTTGKGRYRRTTHAWMRAYLRSKKKSGSPRKALKQLQQVMA